MEGISSDAATTVLNSYKPNVETILTTIEDLKSQIEEGNLTELEDMKSYLESIERECNAFDRRL